jgi:hypothetical protein
VADTTGLPAEDVESYLSTLSVAPAAKLAGPLRGAVNRASSAEIAATDAVKAGAGRAAQAAGDVKRGIDIGRIGEYEGAPSAYQPISPEALKQMSPRDQQIIKNAGGVVETQGMGAQALGENLVKNIKGNFSTVPKTAADLAFHGIPAMMTGGASLPATLAMDYLGRPMARTALDARMGSRARLVPGAEGELAVRPGGDLVGGATNRGGGLTTPAAAIDTATGAISPMDAAAIRKQRFDQENAAKLAQVQQEQAQRMAQTGARSATPEELVESNPMILAVKQRAQAQLPSTPKDLAIDAVTGTSNPAVTAVAAQDKAKQMLSPDMRAQIEARVAAQKAAQEAKMQETMSAPAIPDQRNTYAPLPTLNDKLAKLKQKPQAGQLFEGLPEEGTTGGGPGMAEARRLEMEAREAAGIEQPDMSDFGKVYTEAQIARKYQQYKDAKSPAAKARLKAEYDRMENARSDRGLNEGGVPGVLEMKIGSDAPTGLDALKTSDNPVARDLAGKVEKRDRDITESVNTPRAEQTAELTMEVMKAGRGNLVPGKNMSLEKVKQQMSKASPNLQWEQVSPTHIRATIGRLEYNVIDSNGDIYQTYRTIK